MQFRCRHIILLVIHRWRMLDSYRTNYFIALLEFRSKFSYLNLKIGSHKSLLQNSSFSWEYRNLVFLLVTPQLISCCMVCWLRRRRGLTPIFFWLWHRPKVALRQVDELSIKPRPQTRLLVQNWSGDPHKGVPRTLVQRNYRLYLACVH